MLYVASSRRKNAEAIQRLSRALAADTDMAAHLGDILDAHSALDVRFHVFLNAQI